MLMSATALPTDILIAILQYLCLSDLAAFSQTSKFLHALVNEFGWSAYLKEYPSHSWSLAKSLRLWKPSEQLRYHALTDRNWTIPHFAARPLACKWRPKLQPTLAVTQSRLFVAAANIIYTYIFLRSDVSTRTPGIRYEGSFLTMKALEASRDITSIAAIPDGGYDRTLCVGYADGQLERIVLPACKPGTEGPILIEQSLRESRPYHGQDVVESISYSHGHVLSLSSTGTVAFHSASPGTPTAEILELKSRSWAAHLTPRTAVLGTSSSRPLAVHAIHESHISAAPSHVLANARADGFEHPRPSAVYGICGTPPGAPWGASDAIVVSGWYDGVVHVHDLRAHARAHAGGALLPVHSMCDPWLFEPMYAVACGGGGGAHVAAGTARHSVVALWDVRAAARGWSVHAPGNDSSPVYSVVLESSRLFGATQARPFVLDFGPELREEDYPPITKGLKEEGLKRRDGSGVGFYVTRYGHSRP